MRGLAIAVLILACVIGGGVAWYKISYPTYTYRFRLAIAVDVGDETKTASSVIEVQTVTRPMSVIFSPINIYVYGDAVFVDLGAKGNVIALLACGPDGTESCVGTLVPEEFGIAGVKSFPQLGTLRGSRELIGKFMPTLITFADLNDPKSARAVRPNQFEQVFGPDVHFKRAWIEMTSDPVTRGIEKKLPWWGRLGRPAEEAYRAWLKGKTAGPSVEPETLFKRG